MWEEFIKLEGWMIPAGRGKNEVRIKEAWAVGRWTDDRITEWIRFPSPVLAFFYFYRSL